MQTQLQRGFTLIELMIVVAIIGILAAVALPAYQDYVARAQVTEAVYLLQAGKTPLAEYYSNNAYWPTAATDAMGTVAGKYVSTITITGGGGTAGTLLFIVGASGTLLTYLMCKAMNRPITNVLFGAFGAAPKAAAGGGGHAQATAGKGVREVTVEDAATGERETFTVVLAEMMDLDAGHISLASPLGRALKDRRPGEEVSLRLPTMTRQLRVIEVITIHDQG